MNLTKICTICKKKYFATLVRCKKGEKNGGKIPVFVAFLYY